MYTYINVYTLRHNDLGFGHNNRTRLYVQYIFVEDGTGKPYNWETVCLTDVGLEPMLIGMLRHQSPATCPMTVFRDPPEFEIRQASWEISLKVDPY